MARIEGWLAGLAPRWVAMLLVVLTLCTALPGFFTLPPVDRDEARFAQSSRQMAESGDLLDIRFQDGTRYKKPVGIYWLQSAAVWAAGGDDQAIWKYRLPSLVAAVAAALMTAALARGFGGSGLVAGLAMAGCVMLGIEARLAKTDAVLLLTVLAAQLPLARAWRGEGLGWGGVALFWGALAASMLVKGPIGPMVTGLCVLALVVAGRRAGWLAALRPVVGVVILVALVVPWYAAITLKSGSAFWAEALGRDLLGKVAEAQESHGAPPGSYLAALWLTFFPGAMVLAACLPAIWRARAMPGITFARCWAVPGWLVFEAAPTKLIHYTLPLYPALALMLALVWPGVAGALRGWPRGAAVVVLALPVLALAGLAAGAAPLGGMPWGMLALGLGLLAATGGVALAALWRGLPHLTLVAGALAGAGFLGAGFGMLERVPALWPAPAVAAALRADATCPAPLLYTTRLNEPSLIFLAPGPVRWVSPQEAAAALDMPCARALVDGREAEAFAAAAGPVRALARVQGINIGNGQRLDLTLWAR